jgi:hypothetical protein
MVFAAKNTTSPQPVSVISVEELGKKIKSLEAENRIRAKYGNTLPPESIQFYLQQEEKDRCSKEKHEKSIIAAKAEESRKVAENRQIARDLLESGTLRVTLNGIKQMQFIGEGFSLPCPSCGTPVASGSAWYLINKHRETKGNRNGMLDYLLSPANNPYDPGQGRSLLREFTSCKCQKSFPMVIQYVIP